MAEYLVIRLGEDLNAAVSWIAVDDRGGRRSHPGEGTLADAALEVRDRPVIALVPGTQVLSLTATVPARGARLLTALPYALEDQLADDIDDLHFAAGERLDNGKIVAAVVSRALLNRWLEELATVGIQPARIVPENHGLVRTPNTLSMLLGDGVLMFNDGLDTEFMLPTMSPAEAIASTGVLDDDASSKHLLVYCDPDVAERLEKDWALLRHELSSVDINVMPDGVLPRLAATVASGKGINLLQGRFGAKTDFTALFRPWRVAALFLLALGVVGLVSKAGDYYRLSVEQESLQQQFTEEYRRIRPADTREIVDPVGTVSSLRRSIGTTMAGPQLFLPSMQELAAAIEDKDSAKVESISYRAGVVDIRLTAPDITTLDQIVQAVATSGRFNAEIKSTDNVGERVQSRIQISEAGA